LNKTGKLKNKLFAHLETMRPYTVIWCGLVSLIGSCIAFGDFPSVKTALLVFFIPMMGWIAGLYLSDYLDKHLDLIEKPHRPIPSGRIKPKEALMVGGFFAVTGFSLSFLLNFYNIILVFIVAILVFLYAKISKSQGILGNVNRGFIIVAAYIFGVFSIDSNPQSIPIYVWLLSLVFFIHDTNSNLVGAIRDVKGDKKGGYETIPVKYGINNSIYISFVLTLVYVLLSAFLIYYFNFLMFPIRFLVLFFLAIVFLFILFMTLLKSKDTISRKQALHAHEFIIAERITFASAFIIGIISSILYSTVIFIVSITVTLTTQYFIRRRYEFEEVP
jgi:4-hydroxybenzoate polyprenyltransferase/geranylgeranylglycerol-phosphate geranylgeranyltransferase